MKPLTCSTGESSSLALALRIFACTALSVEWLAPNSRSNTLRGLFSIGSGVVGVRHAILLLYAQLNL